MRQILAPRLNLGRNLGGLIFEINGGEGREREGEGKRLIHVRNRIGYETSQVADVGATVDGRVGIENFGVKAGFGDADEVSSADDGSGIHNNNKKIAGILSAPEEGENAVVGVIGVQPFESTPVEFDFMQCRLGSVEPIEVRDETLNAPMGVMLQEMPIQAASFAPFITLGKFLTHEKELFARMSILISEQEPEIGKFLPEITGHFVEKRFFPMHHFIVGKGKQKILAEGVEKRKGEIVVLVLAVNGID